MGIFDWQSRVDSRQSTVDSQEGKLIAVQLRPNPKSVAAAALGVKTSPMRAPDRTGQPVHLLLEARSENRTPQLAVETSGGGGDTAATGHGSGNGGCRLKGLGYSGANPAPFGLVLTISGMSELFGQIDRVTAAFQGVKRDASLAVFGSSSGRLKGIGAAGCQSGWSESTGPAEHKNPQARGILPHPLSKLAEA